MTYAPLAVPEAPAGSSAAIDFRAGWDGQRATPWPSTLAERPSYPRFTDKHGEPSVTSPEVFLTEPLEEVPRLAVLAYTKFLDPAINAVLAAHPGQKESKAIPGLHLLGDGVALVRNTSLLGAPMAVVQLERLIAAGVRRFIILGIAGSLRESTPIGQVVVCDRAVRDEGTSHHYLPHSDHAYPADGLPRQLAHHLRNHGIPVQIGGTWTTDAIFRETLLEVRRLADDGILTVEMEASALFTVARFRGVEVGAVFAVSDLVFRRDWERGQGSTALAESLLKTLAGLVRFP